MIFDVNASTEQRKLNSSKRWYVSRVVRTDSGGTLWAPVDRHTGLQYDVTPSYDGMAMHKLCGKLNAKELERAEADKAQTQLDPKAKA